MELEYRPSGELILKAENEKEEHQLGDLAVLMTEKKLGLPVTLSRLMISVRRGVRGI